MVGLFGKPGQELDEGKAVTPDEIRALGQCLHERLNEAADIIDKLNRTGWESEMSLYDVILSHPYLRTEAEVESKLLELGIDPQKVCIMEDPDEDEYEMDEMDTPDEPEYE
jgi:hypothetical protein